MIVESIIQNTIKPQVMLPNRPIRASCGLCVYDNNLVANLDIMTEILLVRDTRLDCHSA